MSHLTPAYSTQFGLKLGAQGEQGSGKTYSLTALAIGLSITYHNRAPIAFFDSEQQSDFIREICEIEGVPLRVKKSKSFIDLRDSFYEAEDSGCCAFIADSYTHPAIELQQAFKEKANLIGRRTQFHHNDQPQLVWGAWVEHWKASPLHCLFAARLGFKWGDVIDEHGDVQKVRLDTKMRGDSDGGYEPNLVIEFESLDNPELRHVKSRSKKGINTHWLRVRKDRCQTLNGRQFAFEETNGYKNGDYAKILATIQPHLDKLSIGQHGLVRPQSPPRSSSILFATPTGESAFAERQKRVAIAIEELQGSINTIWPGSTNEEKRLKLTVMQTLFKSRSWTAIECLLPEKLEAACLIMRHFEEAAPQISVKDEAKVIDLIQRCVDLEAQAETDRQTAAVM